MTGLTKAPPAPGRSRLSLRLRPIACLTRLFLILAAATSLQSCTSLSTLYYWSDTYISSQIDSYFDLNDEQEAFVEWRLDHLLLQYKQQEIPKYIRFLEEIKARSRDRLTPEDLEWFRHTLNQFNQNIAYLLAEDTTLFLMTVSDKQLKTLEHELAEANREVLEESRERDAASEEKQLQRIYDNIEEWIGPLTEEQKQQIVAMGKPGKTSQNIWYQRRLASQRAFLKIMDSDLDQQQLKKALLDWYPPEEEDYSAEYREYRNRRNARSDTLVLILSRTATDEQIRHFHRKLDNYIEELKEILT